MRMSIVSVASVAAALAVAFLFGRISMQGIVAACKMCSADYIPKSELEEYEAIGRATPSTRALREESERAASVESTVI